MNALALSGRFLLGLVLTLSALHALGEEEHRHTFTRDGRTLQLSISSQFDPAMQEPLQNWIAFISDSLLQVYGYWPRKQWEISITPAPAADSDPIPWAQVHRDEVDRVEFYTAVHATAEELIQEWTGYHELAHLLIPYRGWGDLWFSEGMATFYQNVLMARAGVLTEQEMWQKLYEGLQRGRADTAFDTQSLTEASAALRTQGGFMRVYWSGAWYFLAVDIRLRRQSGGELTLDRALQKLNQCCADQHLSVPQIVSKLDELNQVLLFQPMYQQFRDSTAVPEFENLFASLGVSIEGKQVVLQQEGPGARLRQQMIQRTAL